MENHQNSPFDRPSQVFRGIRFVLIGFDPINKTQVSRKLVDGGGIDAGQYVPSCTHVIVNKLVYDDPICVAARRDEKILVSGLWADHSFDVGVPVDPTSVMYRPVRDLNGIQGAKSLVICLTGYQREDREDIMTMVDLMGAQFSKPLIANKVTHLICYKFEGEKYLLAKKMKKIKLINHRWLEDCLKAWEIVSEADYTRSGYELEMEAEAKDSEDEAGGVTIRLNEVKKESPHQSVMLKQDVSTSVPNTSASKGFESADDMVSVTMKSTSDQFLNPQKNVIGVTCNPSNLFEGTTSGSVAKKSPLSESRKVISPIHSRKMPMENTPSKTDTTSNINSGKRPDKINLSDDFIRSPSLVEKEEQNGSSCGKRKMEISSGSLKLQKTSHNEDALNRESLHVESGFQELEKDPFIEMSNRMSRGFPCLSVRPPVSPAQNRSSKSTEKKLQSSKGKSEPNSKISTPKIVQDKEERDGGLKETTKFESRDVGKVQVEQPESETPGAQKVESLEKSSSSPPCAAVMSGFEKSTTPKMSGGSGSSSKPVRRKSIAKKFSAPKQSLGKKKTVIQKGCIRLEENSEPRNDNPSATVGDDSNLFNNHKEEDQISSGAEVEREMLGGLQKSLGGMDDETEPPEDKDEEAVAVKEKHGDGGDIVMEENANAANQNAEDISDVGNSVSVNVEDKSDKTSRDKKRPPTKKVKKKTALSVKDVSDKKAAKNKEELSRDDSKEKAEEVREEATPARASKRIKKNGNDLEKKTRVEGVCPESKNDDSTEHVVVVVGSASEEEDEVVRGKSGDAENAVNNKTTTRNKPKKGVKDPKLGNKKKGKSSSGQGVKACDLEAQKENIQIPVDGGNAAAGNKQTLESESKAKKKMKVNSEGCMSSTAGSVEPMWFILSGHKLQKREFQHIIRRLKGKICRVSHQWSYQATHFIVPDPIRRTEKFFAAAASGSWILKTDYLSASNEAGRFLPEEPYEWHKTGLSEDGQINMEAPRKWRLLKEKTGHGAFHGMRILIYGECIAPTLDTLKRAVKAGDGTIVATSPPYTRFLDTGIDYAIVSPGMPHVDMWVQELIKHEIPCVSADYLVEYVCKPGYPLDRHVQFDTNAWAERSYNNLQNRGLNGEPATPESNDDVACEVCGSRDRGEEMLICGSENGSMGCGVGMHIDCCDPSFEDVPEGDWFCPNCSNNPNTATITNSKKTTKRKGP